VQNRLCLLSCLLWMIRFYLSLSAYFSTSFESDGLGGKRARFMDVKEEVVERWSFEFWLGVLRLNHHGGNDQ